MGILRKRPGEKVKIDPLKLWGGITILALFASLSVYLLAPKSSHAIVPDAGGGGGAGDSAKAEGGTLKHEDPNCPEINQGEAVDGMIVTTDEEAGLVVVCGRVLSARIDPLDEDSDGHSEYNDTRNPVKGATVAIYEADPNTDTGKSANGNLVHLFSSTATNSSGSFKLKMRGLGPKSSSVYVVVYCGREYKGGQRLNSMMHVSNLDIAVDCDSYNPYSTPSGEYEYKTPYGAVIVVEHRDSILECTVNVVKDIIDTVAHIAVAQEKPASVAVEGGITETNYDFRYVPKYMARTELGATGINVEQFLMEETQHRENQGTGKPQGALWANDCVVANSDHDSSSLGEGAQIVGLGKDELGDAWVCSSAAMDDEYGEEGGYLVNTALRFIPESPDLLAWRRLDNRASIKQMNQYPFASLQAFSSMFGDYVGVNQFIPDPLNQSWADANKENDKLASCEAIEASTWSVNLFNPAPEVGELLQNTKLSAGFGMMLSSPYLWDSVADLGVSDIDLDRPYCVTEGGTEYTGRQVMEDLDLKDKYFRPELLLPKGAANMPWNNQVISDSCLQDYNVRTGELYVMDTEAQQHCHDQTKAVLPEGTNANASSMAHMFTTGELLEEESNMYTMMDSPFGDTAKDTIDLITPEPPESDDEEDLENVKLKAANIADRPTIIMDIGNAVTGICGVSEVYDDYLVIGRDFLSELATEMHNFFWGNKDHIEDNVVGSGSFYTPDSIRRDELLDDSFGWGADEFGDIPSASRDLFDSLLEISASEDKVDFANTNTGDLVATIVDLVSGSGDTKSFGDRTDDAFINFRPRYVHFEELNAENFETVFPAYGEGGYPGSNPAYPWPGFDNVATGQLCNVWPGPGNDPVGEIRTCKIVDCRVEVKEWKEDSDGDLYLDEYDEFCNTQERTEILKNQEDTENKWFGLNPPRYLGSKKEVVKADLVRALGYRHIEPIELKLDAKLQQDDLLGSESNTSATREPAKSHDSISESAYRFRRMFRSPGEDVKGGRIAMNDWEYSKNPMTSLTEAQGAQGDYVDTAELYGYDAPGYGFDPASSGLNSISASPTTFGRGQYNDIIYHCNITFEDSEGNPRPTPSSIGDPVIPTWGPSGTGYVDFADDRYYWECPVRPFVIGTCDTGAYDAIPGGMSPANFDAVEYFTLYSLEKFLENPELLEAYGFASANTGVPCEILAGIHHMEGSNNPDQSLWDGHPIDPGDLPMDALTAAQHLLGKVSYKDIEEWTERDYIKALDHYNGPGNRNCDDPRTPWCPSGSSLYTGWDHPYPMSWLDADGDHTNMFIKYCYDFTLCTEAVTGDPSGWLPVTRPGALATANSLNQFLVGGP